MTTQGVRHYQIVSPAIPDQNVPASVNVEHDEHAEAELLFAAQQDLGCFTASCKIIVRQRK